MKILMVLFLYTVLTLGKSDQLENDSRESTVSNVPARRRLLFPKLNIKYTVKLHETDKKLGIQNTREDTETRKPLMVKMVPRTKKTVVKTTEVVTRKPLMKVKSFTVKMRSLKTETFDDIHKREPIHKSARSFASVDKSEMKKYMSEMNKLDGNHLNKLNKNIIATGLKKSLEKTGLLSELDQDRNEFIFIEKSKDFKNAPLYESKEDFDTTTINTETRKHRRIRSSNIIEEENMGTTISPLKFTGHDRRLTNNLYFKNINH